MKTITFIYNTDTEDVEEAVDEARQAISNEHYEPFEIEDQPDKFWEEGNDV